MRISSSAQAVGALVVTSCVFGSPMRASADDVRAKASFQEGLRLLDAKQDDAACTKFRESLAAEPSVGAMLNVAMCSTRENKLAQAQEEYRALLVLNEATADAERRKNVDARAREAMRSLSPRVPTLEITIEPAPEALAIELDGKPFERSRLGSAQPVDPGEHVIKVSAQGFAPLERRVRVRESERQRHALALDALPKPAAQNQSHIDGAVAGWVTAGAGVAGLVVGGALLGVAGMRASEIEDLCGEDAEPPRCEPANHAAAATEVSHEGRALAIGGWVSLAVGGALAATGTVLLATSLGSAERAVSLVPGGPGGPGLSLIGRF